MQETLLNIVAKANGYLADYILIILCIYESFSVVTKY